MKRILKENESPPLSSLQENIYRRISVKMNIFKKWLLYEKKGTGYVNI